MPLAPPLLYTDPRTGELRRRRWSLRVVDGVDLDRACTIEQTPALIGAAPAATLVLTDDTVSRYHLELDVFAEGIRLRDLDSTNGTFVGATRIRDAFVEPGEVFRLGRTTIRAEALEEPAAPEIDTDPLGLPLGAVERIGKALAVSVTMRSLFEDLRKVARSSSTVLFEGEPGVGKATLARTLHDLSARKAAPFITVTLARGAEVAEAELRCFGGPGEDGPAGAYERATGGTLFLEHIDHLPTAVQRRLLRVIESGELGRPGDARRRRVDVRLVVSTSSPAATAQLEPRLLRRLAVVRLVVPPLRERTEDLGPLAATILGELGAHLTLTSPGPRLLATLARLPWPGNVDELQRALGALTEVPAWLVAAAERGETTGDRLRRAALEDLLARAEGDVSALAERLGVPTPALWGWAAREDVDVDASDRPAHAAR